MLKLTFAALLALAQPAALAHDQWANGTTVPRTRAAARATSSSNTHNGCVFI